MRHTAKTHRMRQQLANEAARIMAEEGISDFHTARRKAANRIGVTNERHLPRNVEIELALKEYQAIFKRDLQPTRLRVLRKTAIEIMRLLERFSPRLVGAVLRGTADRHSAINIHLFTDNSQALDWLLMEHHIPFKIGERECRFNENDLRRQPLYLIEDGEIEVELTVFPEIGIRQAPKSPLDGKPVQRASISDVEKLLQQT